MTTVIEETIDIARILQARTRTYALLSRLFLKEVDAGLLDGLMEMKLPASTGNEHLDRAYRLLQTYLSTAWERTLSDLSKDYVRTFIGNSVDAFSAAYPSESVHTTGLRLVMQDARDEVLTIYRAAGMDKVESWHEGEDHIAAELEFMKTISARSEEAAGSGDGVALDSLLKTQLNFLQDHLINWVPILVGEMDRFAKTEFYRALGHWLLGFLENDREFLQDALRINL